LFKSSWASSLIENEHCTKYRPCIWQRIRLTIWHVKRLACNSKREGQLNDDKIETLSNLFWII
jgi:hypothetical protein